MTINFPFLLSSSNVTARDRMLFEGQPKISSLYIRLQYKSENLKFMVEGEKWSLSEESLPRRQKASGGILDSCSHVACYIKASSASLHHQEGWSLRS